MSETKAIYGINWDGDEPGVAYEQHLPTATVDWLISLEKDKKQPRKADFDWVKRHVKQVDEKVQKETKEVKKEEAKNEEVAKEEKDTVIEETTSAESEAPKPKAPRSRRKKEENTEL